MRMKNTSDEVSAGIDISVFLGTASLFFVGILIAKLNDLNSQIRVGILFLIVATFAFIFSSIIYANVSGSDENEQKKRKYFIVGNAVSEFLGLYVFTIAIPLVVTSLTNDRFMQVSALIVTLVALVSYTVSPFSMVNRIFLVSSQVAYSIILVSLVAALTIGQIYTKAIFIPLAICALIFFTVSALVFARLSNRA